MTAWSRHFPRTTPSSSPTTPTTSSACSGSSAASTSRASQQNVEVIPLKLAYADDLAPQIEKIMSARKAVREATAATLSAARHGRGRAFGAGRRAAAFKVVPDERTNSLIVLAGPLQMRQINDLIVKLDIHPPNENSRIHVYQLKNAPAGEMVQVLNGLLGGGGGRQTLSPATGRNSLGRGGSGRYGRAAASARWTRLRRRDGWQLRRRRWRRLSAAAAASAARVRRFGGSATGGFGGGRWAAVGGRAAAAAARTPGR